MQPNRSRSRRQCTGLMVCWIMLCFLGTGIAGCSRGGTGIEEAIERSRLFVHELRERFQIPGMSVAVAIDDSIVWSETFGYANVEKKIPVHSQTMFRAASVSKVLTAAGIAVLVEQGRLDLDAPVQQYVPEFPKKFSPFTTRQLAGHLSGIRDYRIDEREDKRHYDDVMEALELFKDDSLLHTPGERHSYSTYGWILISAIVQRASGKPFLEFMKDHIFEPLGMANTEADDVTREIPNRATFYTGPEEIAPPIDVSYKWAGAGFLSTAEDLARFGASLLPGGDFLKSETTRLLFTNQQTNDGTEVMHGLGWIVQTFENGKPLYFHPGSMIGSQAILVIQPEDGVVVAMLANRSGGFGELAANQIACYFLGIDEENCPEIEGERKRRIEKYERYLMLNAAVKEWKTAVEEGNRQNLMLSLSENFGGTQWKDKHEMMAHFQRVFADGPTTVDDENLHMRFQSRGYPMGALTYVEGIKTSGSFGTHTLRLTFIREESDPLITNLEIMEP